MHAPIRALRVHVHHATWDRTWRLPFSNEFFHQNAPGWPCDSAASRQAALSRCISHNGPHRPHRRLDCRQRQFLSVDHMSFKGFIQPSCTCWEFPRIKMHPEKIDGGAEMLAAQPQKPAIDRVVKAVLVKETQVQMLAKHLLNDGCKIVFPIRYMFILVLVMSR